jgi:hypothetical protein
MSEKRIYTLADEAVRRRAMAAVADAPLTYRVTLEPPRRNLDQNALLWVWLTAFAERLVWPVNGAMVKLSPDEWKDLLTAAYRQESQRVAMGINGGMVMLGMRTSKMSKAQFAEFIEFVQSVAADRGVTLADEVPA